MGDFPNKPPVLQVVAVNQYLHPFLDQRGFLLPSSHPKLANWTPRDSLGKMIYEILPKLTNGTMGPPLSNNNNNNPNQPSYQAPPNQSNQTSGRPGSVGSAGGVVGVSPYGSNPSSQNYASNPSPNVGNYSSNPPNIGNYQPNPSPNVGNYASNPPNVGNYGSNLSNRGASPINTNSTPPNSKTVEYEPLPVPKVPSNFPDLQQKSVEELELLLSDDEAFSLLVEEQEIIQNLKKLRMDITQQNEESASNIQQPFLLPFFPFSNKTLPPKKKREKSFKRTGT